MTEIIYIPNIENYNQHIINGDHIFIPKQNYITEDEINNYKNINHNGMNLFEVIIDLSKALDINLFNDKHFHFTIAGLIHHLQDHLQEH
jgi:hypothetical protein